LNRFVLLVVGLLDLVPLFLFAAAAKEWHKVAKYQSDAAVVVWLSGQNSLFCHTNFIWTLAATVFLLRCVQVYTELVVVAKILVPREKD